MFIGGWDNYWLAFYAFGQTIGAVYESKTRNHFNAYLNYSKQCGAAFLYADVAIVSDRPSLIKFDEEKRLHCENGPALEYKDGFSVYSWRGTRIPGDWISSGPPSAADALRWSNMEQRRAACEIVGWNNILRELNAKSIQKDDDASIGELIEVDIPDIGRERFVRARCGTNREFALPVPPTMKTALEAQAWMHNVSEEDILKLEVRT
ncbi:MAG: DUF6745 domain-containing protein [Pseudomonadota bacterium]